MTAAVLSIGTEITRGEITNTNASFLAEELTKLGVDVTEMLSIPDDPEAIVRELRRLGAVHSLIVSTGGLGPTTDDITSESVAKLLGVPLVRDEPSLQAIVERMSRFGRTVAPSNAKQADFPTGATILPNPNGTAPGFSVTIGRAAAFFMPGVPAEMKPMFGNHVAPRTTGAAAPGIHQIRLRTFGVAESTVNDKLAGVEAAHDVVIGYRAHFPEIEVKVLARRGTPAEAERVARVAADEVKSRLGNIVYGEGEKQLAAVVGARLRERGLTIGTAESCTGGLVAELLTDEPGASAWFRGSVVAYRNEVKAGVLGVPEALIAEHGAVSEAVARSLAEGARRVLGTDVGVAVVGVAGPGGGTEEKPVGLVHYAVSTASGTTAERLNYPANRRFVRVRAAWAALGLVLRVIG
ncbi:MAG TPA: competence/damage-inducible protein A [Polyangiaceae bacterium]|nr:competence/damage-inducible protein A [Polyangiaceae bacterium]